MSYYCPTHSYIYESAKGCPKCGNCQHEFVEYKKTNDMTIVQGNWVACKKCGLHKFILKGIKHEPKKS